jgi:hypothetical protein
MGDLNELYYSISGFHEQDRLFPVEGTANLFTRVGITATVASL